MPKVRRKNVPRAAIEHLALRVRERAVPIEDLQNLAKWLDTEPTVPSGRWFLRQQLGDNVHFWPFDGWKPPGGKSVIAEVYPALWNRAIPAEARNAHQHDAYSVAFWMQQADTTRTLPRALEPKLQPAERTIAQIEGWILGLA